MKCPDITSLEEFPRAFFCAQVKSRQPIQLSECDITRRVTPYTGAPQLLTVDILDMLGTSMPADALCVLGITMFDLYPDPSWNFVFGRASPRRGARIYSFARYDPTFNGEESSGQRDELLLRRSSRVLAHEICHMLNMRHCIYFRCLINGSNHLQERNARPLHVCLACHRKLYHALRFDPVERYQRLCQFWKAQSNGTEVEWLDRRLEHIRDDPMTG